MTLEPPPNDFSEKIALFLDIDGTLVEFADTPGEVASSSSLRVILSSLWISLGGALALISGRCIEDIDKIFYPLRLPVSGQHGLERRNADGSIQKVTMVSDLEEIRLSLEKFVRKYETRCRTSARFRLIVFQMHYVHISTNLCRAASQY